MGHVALAKTVVSGGVHATGRGHADCVTAARIHNEHPLPQSDIAGPRRQIPDRYHSPVGSQRDSVQVPGGDPDEVSPAPDRTLSAAVVTDRYGGPVSSQSDRVPVTAGDGDDALPAPHIAGAFGGPTGGDHGPVAQDAQRAPPTSGDSHDILPRRDLALLVTVPPCGEDRAVRTQPNGVRLARVGCRVNIARRDGDHRIPVVNATLACTAISDRDHGAVVAHGNGVPPAGGQHRPAAPGAHAVHTPRVGTRARHHRDGDSAHSGEARGGPELGSD